MRAATIGVLVAALAFIGYAGAQKSNTIKITWFGPETGDSALWG